MEEERTLEKQENGLQEKRLSYSVNWTIWPIRKQNYRIESKGVAAGSFLNKTQKRWVANYKEEWPQQGLIKLFSAALEAEQKIKLSLPHKFFSPLPLKFPLAVIRNILYKFHLRFPLKENEWT